ncbi:MAG: hypothetical protein KIS73_15305 [Enhydrobacter sp.]|nr:hypothetical protein [Enhydrobacter sp.]
MGGGIMDLRQENCLIGALYDAALGHRRWEEVGQRIVTHMGGTILMLSTHDSRTGDVDVVTTQGVPAQALQEYGHFAQHDLWASGYIEQGLDNRARIGSHIVDDSVLLRSYIYNEYLRPKVDSRYVAGAVLALENGHHAVVGVHRPHGAEDFSLQEAARLDRLLPHIQRSVEMRRRLRAAEQRDRSTCYVLDRLSLGIVLVAATGHLLHANRAAEATLGSGDGLARAPDGLRAANREDDKRLQRLINGIRHGGGDLPSAGGHLSVRRLSGRPAYGVMVSPAAPGLTPAAKQLPAVLVFVSDPAAEVVSDLAVLSDLFGFTPAESRLVMALLAGGALPDIARQLGVSYHTVRTLLARAMSRTDTRSQLELVMLAARSLGSVAPPLCQH